MKRGPDRRRQHDPGGTPLARVTDTEEGRVVGRKRSKPPRTIWAYAYQIVPPQTEHRLRAIKTLLGREHSAARGAERIWTGRLVFDPLITHILVVSDSPEVDLAINRKLEAQLKVLKAKFLITAPLAVPEPIVASH